MKILCTGTVWIEKALAVRIGGVNKNVLSQTGFCLKCVNVMSLYYCRAGACGGSCRARHPNVTVVESLKIWKQPKLSLNVMLWHKGGYAERMANIVLAGGGAGDR